MRAGANLHPPKKSRHFLVGCGDVRPAIHANLEAYGLNTQSSYDSRGYVDRRNTGCAWYWPRFANFELAQQGSAASGRMGAPGSRCLDYDSDCKRLAGETACWQLKPSSELCGLVRPISEYIQRLRKGSPLSRSEQSGLEQPLCNIYADFYYGEY